MANVWNGPVRPSAMKKGKGFAIPAPKGGVRVPGSGHVRYELSQAKKDAKPRSLRKRSG